MSSTCTGTMVSGTGTTIGLRMTGMPIIRLPFSQLFSFLSLFGRVLFCKLTIPSTEHFPDFFKRYREGNVLLIIYRFCFPQDHKQDFQSIYFPYRESHIGLFLIAWQKPCKRYGFHYFYKQGINPYSKRVAMSFRQVLIILIP
jgi:hypothetical protein